MIISTVAETEIFSTRTASPAELQEKYREEFATDVLHGLSKRRKSIPSKYFYDKKGSELFADITQLPEYYLTGCEHEIFQKQGEVIVDQCKQLSSDALAKNTKRAGSEKLKFIDVIELGAGDGHKTFLLLKHFFNLKGIEAKYFPIDISRQALESLSEKFLENFSASQGEAVLGDYFQGLDFILTKIEENRGVAESSRCVLFLGATIGNFSKHESEEFLFKVRGMLSKEDTMLIGFDLKKDPATLLRAYNDSKGVTRNFNINLLQRMNSELQATFKLNKFAHYPTFNPVEGAMESFLLSLEKQKVYINALEKTVNFQAYEALQTEVSYKYTLDFIEDLAYKTGFQVVENFLDKQNFYANSLWKPISKTRISLA